MNKYQFIAYGDEVFGYVVVEVKSDSLKDGMAEALKCLKQNNVNFDTVEPLDESFLKRVEWL